MTTNQLLATGLRVSGGMIEGMAGELSAAELLHRPCGGANCAAWIVGHMILVDRSMMKRLGVDESDLPPLADDFTTRFGRDEHAPKRDDYGDTSSLVADFRRGRALFAQKVESADAARLDAALENPSPRFKTVGEMANFAATHSGLHAGHLSTIRRSLGRPPLF